MNEKELKLIKVKFMERMISFWWERLQFLEVSNFWTEIKPTADHQNILIGRREDEWVKKNNDFI